MVESTARTSTSSDSAAASDATGWAGASTDVAGPAATWPVEVEHAASRSRTARVVRAWREAMVPEDSALGQSPIKQSTTRAYRFSLSPGDILVVSLSLVRIYCCL